MQWDGIRRMQPNAWVLVEALRSRSEDGWWIIEDMALIQVFSHASEAWEEYKALHKADEYPGSSKSPFCDCHSFQCRTSYRHS